LFFENIFIFGDILATSLSFIFLAIVFWITKILIKKIILNFDKNLLVIATYYMLFLSSLSFTADTLNTIRSLPFDFIPAVLYYVNKFVRNYNFYVSSKPKLLTNHKLKHI